MKLNKIIFLFLMTMPAVLGCEQKPSLRVYEEVNFSPLVQEQSPLNQLPEGHPPITQGMDMNTTDPQMKAMLQASVASVPLTWQTPEGWNEEKGSGMRLVTFTSKDKSVTCTIVSLSGSAGGIESNVIRWMQQLNLDPQLLSGDKFADFMSKQERIKSQSGLDIQLINLTGFQSHLSAQSIVGAIVNLEHTTIFIKMMGTNKSIKLNHDSFKVLVRSLSLNE